MGNPVRWVMLVFTLPAADTARRMRLWRRTRSLGSALLRDGVHVLPESPAHRKAFRQLAAEISAADGVAHVLDVTTVGSQTAELRRRFDRSDGYAALLTACTELTARIEALGRARAQRALGALERDAEALQAIDFYPGAMRQRVDVALGELQAAVHRLLAPGEPRTAGVRITPRPRKDYRNRTWATRRNLWIDRVASAWLIRRHIDRKARFVWLAVPARRPQGAVGFDFDGAEFSHVGSRVTFETLLASFGLRRDAALERLGTVVHALDVGGIHVPEAKGIETLLAGLKRQHPKDDDFLAAASAVFDGFYAAFRADKGR